MLGISEERDVAGIEKKKKKKEALLKFAHYALFHSNYASSADVECIDGSMVLKVEIDYFFPFSAIVLVPSLLIVPITA